MAALSAGKIAEVWFEEYMLTIDDQTLLSDQCERIQPDGGDMQNSGNIINRPVEQQAEVIEGWDLTGKEAGIIEETYPSVLGEPQNTFVEMRADNMRTLDFWRKSGKRAAMQMAVTQNQSIANAIMNQGSLYIESAATDGFDFLSNIQVIMNEQQRYHTERKVYLNDRTNQKFGKDLAGRQTLQGRPEEVWSKGQIGANIAENDIYVASFLPTLTGGVETATTVVGNQSFKPEGGNVTATGIVSNVDYRYAAIPVVSSAAYEIGDKFKFVNTAVDVTAVGASTKQDTDEARTFTVVGVPSAGIIEIYPKPIAIEDTALTGLERQYSNVQQQILDGAELVLLNTATAAKTNLFFDKDAVEVISGTIPAGLFSEYNGHKVISSTMKNGQPVYMVYDANIVNMNFRYRLFSWWGVTIKDPMRCGVAISV